LAWPECFARGYFWRDVQQPADDPALPAEPIVEPVPPCPGAFWLAVVPEPVDDPELERAPEVPLGAFIALESPAQPGRDADPFVPLLPETPGELVDPAPLPMPPAPPAAPPPAPLPAP
jgi:hypothetical protein